MIRSSLNLIMRMLSGGGSLRIVVGSLSISPLMGWPLWWELVERLLALLSFSKLKGRGARCWWLKDVITDLGDSWLCQSLVKKKDVVLSLYWKDQMERGGKGLRLYWSLNITWT